MIRPMNMIKNTFLTWIEKIDLLFIYSILLISYT